MESDNLLRLSQFISYVYSSLDGVKLEIDNNSIIEVYFNKSLLDTLHCKIDEDSTDESNVFILITSSNFGDTFKCSDSCMCIDDFIRSLLIKSKTSSNLSLEEDEVDDSLFDRTADFSRIDIERIISDLSVVVVSKLMFEDNLIGFRFRLNNGCLDISVDKGKELGIVPYKIGKRVQLSAINGVLASNYECSNKVLFPDISNDDELCRRLLNIVLS